MTQADVARRRWLQFSLRTLFVLMLVVAAFFGGRESMRPAIEAERAKSADARALAELQRAQALAHAAQIQALSAATQAELDRVVARRKEFEAHRLLHHQQIQDLERKIKDAAAAEAAATDKSANPQRVGEPTADVERIPP